MTAKFPSANLSKEKLIPGFENHKAILNLNVEQKCPIMTNTRTTLGIYEPSEVSTRHQLNSHVTELYNTRAKLVRSTSCAASSSIDSVDGPGKLKLTDHQRNELTSIFQKMGQPSPSVVLEISFQLNLSPIAAERFFRNAKRQSRVSRVKLSESKPILTSEYHRLSDNGATNSSGGISNQIAFTTSLITSGTGGRYLSSVRRRWNAFRNRTAILPLPDVKTIKLVTKNKCYAVSDGIQKCCSACDEICLCTCLMCCLFCCCCCHFCYRPSTPNRSILL